MHLGQLLELICDLGNKDKASDKKILIFGAIDLLLGQQTKLHTNVNRDLKTF